MDGKMFLLGGFLITVIAIAAFSVSSYASGKSDLCDYRSYTRTIKMCNANGSCLMQDFLVECCGGHVTNITSIGNYMPVPKNHRESNIGWCD
jgi:hypothetical protein